MNERQDRIALLIDADNSPSSKIDVILAELAKIGVTNIRRAYGNWKKDGLKGWESVLHEYAIRPIQQFDYSKGKNATDMGMVIDAMDLLYTDQPEAFGIVSSDSDFTPLVMHLKAKGAQVFGFGAKKTPMPFVNACSRFLYLENLGRAIEVDDVEKDRSDRADKVGAPARKVSRRSRGAAKSRVAEAPADGDAAAADDQGVDENSVAERSGAKRSGARRSGAERSGAERSTDERSTDGRSAAERSAAERSAADTSAGTDEPPGAAQSRRAGRDGASAVSALEGGPLRLDSTALRRDARLVALLRNAVESAAAEDGWSALGAVGQQIGNQASFDPRNYGYRKLIDLFEASALFEIDRRGSQVVLRDKRVARSTTK